MTGYFTDSIQLGCFLLSTDSIGQFLCKISPAGNFIWAKNLFNSMDNYFSLYPPVIKIDHSGQIVIAGTCQTLNANFDTIINAFSSGDLYIAKFNTATGALNSFLSTGRHIYNYIYDMDIDLNDNIYLAGSFVGVINFGGISMSCSGQTNSFIAKFSSQNQVAWARRITTVPNTTGNAVFSIDYDNYNHIYASGWYGLNAGFGNGITLNSTVYSNGFLAKYDLSGNIEWAKTSDTNKTYFHQFINDTNSIIIVESSPDIMINYDQNGDTLWTKVISNNTSILFSEVKKFNGKYFGIGGFYNSVYLEGTTYTATGSDFFCSMF